MSVSNLLVTIKIEISVVITKIIMQMNLAYGPFNVGYTK